MRKILVSLSAMAVSLGIAFAAGATTSDQLITSAAGDLTTQLITNFDTIFVNGVYVVIFVVASFLGIHWLIGVIKEANTYK